MYSYLDDVREGVVDTPTVTVTDNSDHHHHYEQRGRRVSAAAVLGAGGRRLSIPFSRERRESCGSYSRIVMCAVDTSDCSRDAFDWYLSQIWKSDDLLIICYCPESPSMPSFTFKAGLSLPTEKWKEILDEANIRTRQLEETYEQACVEKKLHYKIRGESYKNVGEGICRIADEEGVNLIVIGSRGINAVKRVFMGSVSEYVVRNANRPTLVVPNKRKF